MREETDITKNHELMPLDYEALLERYFPRMYAAALNVTRNREDAQDAAQNVFVRLMERNTAPDETTDNPAGYMCRRAINEAKRIMQSPNRRREKDTVNGLELIAPLAQCGVGNDLSRQLQRGLDKLDPETLEIVILHYKEGYSGDEIAPIVGKTRPAVAKILQRAREELRKHVGMSGEPNGTERERH